MSTSVQTLKVKNIPVENWISILICIKLTEPISAEAQAVWALIKPSKSFSCYYNVAKMNFYLKSLYILIKFFLCNGFNILYRDREKLVSFLNRLWHNYVINDGSAMCTGVQELVQTIVVLIIIFSVIIIWKIAEILFLTIFNSTFCRAPWTW